MGKLPLISSLIIAGLIVSSTTSAETAKPADKPAEKAATKPAEKAADNAADKATKKTAETPADKPATKPCEAAPVPPPRQWNFNFVEMGMAMDGGGSPNGAVFSYSHAFPLFPKQLKDHLGLELKLQTPPLLPNITYRNEDGQSVIDAYYGIKAGPLVRINKYLTASVVGGIFVQSSVRAYNNTDKDKLTALLETSGDVDANGAVLMTWGYSIQPTARLTLGAFTLGGSVELYKANQEIDRLQPGGYVTAPAKNANLDTGNINAGNAKQMAQKAFDGTVNTDNMGKAQMVDGVWRTRLVLTVGINF